MTMAAARYARVAAAVLARMLAPAASLTLALAIAGAGGCAHPRSAAAPDAVPATKPPYEHAAETGIPIASTPQGLLLPGAERLIQDRLRDAQLLTPAQCTGVLDAGTREALRIFQKREGLPTTGLPSYETVRHLRLDLAAVFHTTPRPREPAHADARR